MSETNFDRDLYLANKSEIASAFGALEQADNISDGEKTVIRRCLSNYNSIWTVKGWNNQKKTTIV